MFNIINLILYSLTIFLIYSRICECFGGKHMLITNKNILKYLDDSKVLLSERESIVKKKEKTLESAAEKLSIDEIIYYLFKSNIPNSAKLTISKVIDEDIKEEKKLKRKRKVI